MGGLRTAARAVDRVPEWKLVGRKQLVSEFEDTLDKALNGLGRKEEVEEFQRRAASLRAGR